MLHELVRVWFSWVENWGYTGVFVLMAMESSIIPVPSEVVMPPAAFWAAQGKMDFTGVVLAGTLGSYCGSIISYWVSQWVGLPLLRKYGKFVLLSPEKLELAERWVQRFGVTGIFIARFLPVVRHLISIPAGILKMPVGRFSAATTIGAGLWCWILAIFGREIIGSSPELIQSPEAMVAVIKAKLHWFVIAVLALATLYAFVIWFKNKSRVPGKLLAVFCISLSGLGLLSSGCGTAQKQVPQERRILFISVDGLHPEDYLSPSSPAVNLKMLAQKGSYAESVIPIYPSLTFPNHASLVTGVRANQHGIISNTIFDLEKGPTRDWYFDSRIISVPTLWDLAREHNRTTALIAWPGSLNAKVNWLVPEIFSTEGINHDLNWQLTLKHTDPLLMKELLEHTTVHRISSNQDYDQWMTEAALFIINKHRPALTLLHYRTRDSVQHEFGRAGKESKSALRFVDAQIGRLIEASGPDTMIIVAGDHGFVDVSQELRPNYLFKKQNWLKTRSGQLSSWKVAAHSGGGMAGIYLQGKDPRFEDSVLKLLEQNSAGRYRVLNRAELDRLQALPHAFCALDPLNGYGFSQSSDGPFVVKLDRTRGEHGALPENPHLWTGFVTAGPGIPSGKNLGKINIIEIAPSIAKLLNVSFPATSQVPKALNLTP